jgi:hypothetical protein
MLEKLLEFLKGKKTYITAAIIALVGFLQAVGVVIPEYVFAILAAFGITFIRAAIK